MGLNWYFFGAIMYITQYGGRETGSSYNFGPMADINVISSVSAMFSEVAVTMQHRVSSYFIKIYEKFNMAADLAAAILNSPASILNFLKITMKEHNVRCGIMTATPENMLITLETTSLSAIGPKL